VSKGKATGPNFQIFHKNLVASKSCSKTAR